MINFDYPQSSEDYIHRIGRTGRSNTKGTSYAFFTRNNAKQSKALLEVLKEANQVCFAESQTLSKGNKIDFASFLIFRKSVPAWRVWLVIVALMEVAPVT